MKKGYKLFDSDLVHKSDIPINFRKIKKKTRKEINLERMVNMYNIWHSISIKYIINIFNFKRKKIYPPDALHNGNGYKAIVLREKK